MSEKERPCRYLYISAFNCVNGHELGHCIRQMDKRIVCDRAGVACDSKEMAARLMVCRC